MLRWLLYHLDERVLFPARTKYLLQHLPNHLVDVESVLDVGASDGRLAHAMSGSVAATFQGCDVLVPEKTLIPVVAIDGKTLPFEDNAFDSVMIIDVLHHDTDPIHLLREAKRVAKQFILLKDHYFDNRLDFFGLQVMDFVGNYPYGISLPYNYLDIPTWKEMFDSLGLLVTFQSQFRFNPIDPCKHVVFKLEIQDIELRNDVADD
jgi:SAM-dependent methyltransferase